VDDKYSLACNCIVSSFERSRIKTVVDDKILYHVATILEPDSNSKSFCMKQRAFEFLYERTYH
jgi:hypothetical protein